MHTIVRIPKKRISLADGDTRKRIESSTKTTILATPAGEVEITGEIEGVMTAEQVVRAIGRGFDPEKAFLLLDERNQLQTFSLEGETEKTIKRLMGRVIGKQGKAKKNIERLSGASISVLGKTVSVIGKDEGLSMASSAVEDLLRGRTHAFIYGRLEKMKRLA